MIIIKSTESKYESRILTGDISAIELTDKKIRIYLSNSSNHLDYILKDDNTIFGYNHMGWVLSYADFKDLSDQLCQKYVR